MLVDDDYRRYGGRESMEIIQARGYTGFIADFAGSSRNVAAAISRIYGRLGIYGATRLSPSLQHEDLIAYLEEKPEYG